MDEKTYNDSQVVMALRKMVKGSSYRKVAESLGISAPYVHDITKGQRALSREVAEKLGFEPYPPQERTPRKWTRKKGA
jgi:signal recognition particle subunit SEC65